MGQTEEEAGMSVDNRTLFSGRAQDYERARPDYAPQLVNALYARYGFSARSRIADVGAGTGKLTGMLLARGSTVYAVEPNADMRAACAARLHGYRAFTCVAGDASHTGLPAGSVDIVTAAQAFHWFDAQAFRAECVRLTGGGTVAILYNGHGEGGIYADIGQISARYCPERLFHRQRSRGAATEDAIRAFFGGKYAVEEADYPLTEDEETFLCGRLSRSYAPRAGEAGFEAYLGEMRELFARYERGGVVTLGNRSVAYIGSV